MSSTRHADNGSPFRQEQFASSQEFQRGLMANLVVKRTEALTDPKERELIWFLQLLSHQDGGLQKVADELVSMFPDRIASPAMQKVGTEPTRVYTADQVRAIRREIKELSGVYARGDEPLCDLEFQFRVCGDGVKTKPEWTDAERVSYELYGIGASLEERQHRHAKEVAESKTYPKSYAASEFLKVCRAHLGYLPELLARFCLDPEEDLHTFTPFWFPTIFTTLRDYMEQWIEARTGGLVTTEIGRRVSEALDYTAEERIMSLIDGMARTGKTFEAKKWCDSHPGLARYVQVPSSNDEVGFYRAIARALGVSINLNSKAHHLRDRIEDVLQSGQLLVCFDEAHFLWPTSNYRGALPKRINWINTALVNHGVPVALITTPQFFIARGATVEKAHWNSDQWDGRLKHYEALPDSLSEEDLSAVAESLLPEGDTATIRGLVAYAQSSAKYLAGIDAVVSRARFLAKRAGRKTVARADVKRAMEESVIPSEKALASAIDTADRKTRPRRGARSMQPVRSEAAERVQPDEEETFTAPPRAVAARETQPAKSGRTPVELVA